MPTHVDIEIVIIFVERDIRDRLQSQGERLVHKAQDGEESLGIPGEAAEFSGEVAGVQAAEQVEGGVADGRPVVRRVAANDPAAVFVEDDIADPMQAVFLTAPVVADQFRQSRRIRFLSRERRDVVRRLDRGVAVLGALPDHATDLLHAGPVQEWIERDAAGQRAAFDSTVCFFNGMGGLSFGFTLPPCVGGKRLRWAQ